jgi:hypothetical protein
MHQFQLAELLLLFLIGGAYTEALIRNSKWLGHQRIIACPQLRRLQRHQPGPVHLKR